MFFQFVWRSFHGFKNKEIPMSDKSIIPMPNSLKWNDGEFKLSESTVVVTCAEFIAEAEALAVGLRPATGFKVPVVVDSAAKESDGAIILLHDANSNSADSHTLEISPERVVVTANSAAGAFYATRSLLQLFPADIFRSAKIAEKDWTVPCVSIEDSPRFAWRGMHFDSARYFMPKKFILKFLDLMALHKLNVFHWHLTEDQGWRLEIKKYPKLTEISAWRKETISGHYNNHPRRFDNTPHGGFYSQDDVREIVAYAAARHITVVPEIEMPGHTSAVLAAYPELGCTGGPYEVTPVWGVKDDVFCAGNENVFEFLENVLSEVMDLFPSEYIHIGGDECPKKRWKECPKCQDRIKKDALKDEEGLQSYFITRMEKFINSHGRRIIGWDEILEGGLAPNAAVMAWRGVKGGVKATELDHDVVFATNEYTYFDYYQSEDVFNEPVAIGGFLPIEKVYAHEPIPEEIPKDKHHLVLGAQGQLWSEYIPSPKQMEYMAFPRLCALSEVVWTDADKKDYEGFKQRLDIFLKTLDVLDVNYRS
jgi:hexosaminidase